MKNNKIIYSLSVEEIQEVALEELGRNLTPDEIQKAIPSIEKSIDWYDIIYYSILGNIESNEEFKSSEE